MILQRESLDIAESYDRDWIFVLFFLCRFCAFIVWTKNINRWKCCFVVLLFCDFVECIKMTDNKTTIQQNYFSLLIFCTSPRQWGLRGDLLLAKDEIVISCLLESWYCLPDSRLLHVCNPETTSRVTLASLGTVFQTDWLTDWLDKKEISIEKCCFVVLLFCCFVGGIFNQQSSRLNWLEKKISIDKMLFCRFVVLSIANTNN